MLWTIISHRMDVFAEETVVPVVVGRLDDNDEDENDDGDGDDDGGDRNDDDGDGDDDDV